MLERIQVNSITHPYSSCILLTPPSTHQINSGFKHSQPHLAAGWTTAVHQLWKMLEHPGNRPLKGNIVPKGIVVGLTASSLVGPHELVTASSGAVGAAVGNVTASLASGHKAEGPLCPELGLPAQHSPTQASPPLKNWLSKAQVRLRSPELVHFQTCLVYFCTLILSL